jgi:hypothetical protein
VHLQAAAFKYMHLHGMLSKPTEGFKASLGKQALVRFRTGNKQ